MCRSMEARQVSGYLAVDEALGASNGFPTYMIMAFVLPRLYGAWRFVLVGTFAGPIVASMRRDNPTAMPAVWWLFSIAILCIGLRPLVRRSVETQSWRGFSTEPAKG